MLKLKRLSPLSKGFTLIELVLVMAIASIILLPILALLNLSISAWLSTEEKDELILNANFAIDFIKFEAKSADLIIDSAEIVGLNSKFPNNLGFVMRKDRAIKDQEPTMYIYNYSTYYFDGNSLIRIACEVNEETYPQVSRFSGYNSICEFLQSIEGSKYEKKNAIIKLDFTFEKQCRVNQKTDIFIRSKFN